MKKQKVNLSAEHSDALVLKITVGESGVMLSAPDMKVYSQTGSKWVGLILTEAEWKKLRSLFNE